MAAIVQSNPYNALIRKIGYSVGIESILKRISILVDEYVAEQVLSYAAWNNIVTSKYGLDKSDKSVEHVANFFSSINILKLYQKDVIPLYGLDILSILRRYFKDDETYLKAIKFILTLLLLEADGDILLNLMSASFDKNKAKNYIMKMLYTKREHYKKAVKTPEIVKIINSIVDIKQQKQGSDKSTIFDKRQVSPFEVRKESLYGTLSDEVNISDDYLKKVPQTRKGWATDLGLYANNSLTEYGRKILTEFLELKLGSGDGDFTFWPYKQELAALYFVPNEIEVPALSKWDVLSHLALINSNVTLCNFQADHDYDNVFELIKLIHRLYRDGDKHKKSIRHQLPLYVLYPVIVAINYATDNCIPDLPQILEKEFKSRERRINKINIAGTEGAVVIR